MDEALVATFAVSAEAPAVLAERHSDNVEQAGLVQTAAASEVVLVPPGVGPPGPEPVVVGETAADVVWERLAIPGAAPVGEESATVVS